MMNDSIAMLTIAVLKSEVEVLKTRLQSHDTGHLYTAINVINERITELEG